MAICAFSAALKMSGNAFRVRMVEDVMETTAEDKAAEAGFQIVKATVKTHLPSVLLLFAMYWKGDVLDR